MDRHEASIGQGVRRGMAKNSTGDKTMILATAESLIGSIWAAFACLAVGYIAGHVVSLDRISGWFKK
jgi:hypothetical protein